MANKELENWNPMEEAYKNPEFNSYVEGPGAKLDPGGGRNKRHGEACEFRLHFANVPRDMTEEGLAFVIADFATPSTVYIHQASNNYHQTTWALVEFSTFGDAEIAMRGCNEQPPYNFIVKFARSKEDRARGGMGDPNNQERDRTAQSDRENKDRPFLTPNRGSQQQWLPPLLPVSHISPSNAANKFQASSVKNSPQNSVFHKNINCSPQESKNIYGDLQKPQDVRSHDGARSTSEAKTGPCGLCQKITSGSCGACGLVWYCSQSCAGKHFSVHVPHCRIPVPAINFSGDDAAVDVPPAVHKNIESPTGNGINLRKFNQGGHMAEVPQETSAVSCYKNEERNGNYQFGHRKFRGGDFNNFNRPSHNNIMQRRSLGSKVPGKEENMSTPTSNKNKFAPPIKQGFDDKKAHNNTQKRICFDYEVLDSKSVWQVKVLHIMPHYIVVMKVENMEELNKMNEKLTVNAVNFPPHDPSETCCTALFEGCWYRATTMKYPGTVMYVDYGNTSMVKPEHIRCLPREYILFRAQGIKVKIQDSALNQPKLNSVINIKITSKLEYNIWGAELIKEDNASSSSAVNPPQKSHNPNLSPFPWKNVPKEPANLECNNQNTPQRAAFPSEVPSLDSYLLVTISHITETAFWASLVANAEQLGEMMDKLNTHVSATSPDCSNQLQVGDLITAFHEDGWYRAKVVKLEPQLKVGLIDYGILMEPLRGKFKPLPAEFMSMPAQAMKFKPYGNSPPFPLNVDSQFEVKAKSLEKVNGCYHVDIRRPFTPSCNLVENVAEKEANETDNASTIPEAVHAMSTTSYPAEELPLGMFTQVDVTHVEDSAVWVNKTHSNFIETSLMKLYSYCNQTRDRIEPKVGSIVAALYDNVWFRAQVLSLMPKISVFFLDYGNTAEITAENVVVLPEHFIPEPAQAIKISFTKNISHENLALREGSSLLVRPVTEEKCADGSIVVEIEDHAGVHVPQEPPPQMPVVVAPVVIVPVEPPAQLAAIPTVSSDCLVTLQPFDLPAGQYTKVTALSQQGWVAIAANVSSLNDMMLLLHKTLNEEVHTVQPAVGDIVSCKFDTFWHRAMVLSVTSTNVRVLYIDYGEEADVPISEISLLPIEFYELPIQAGKITFVEGTPENYCRLVEEQVLEVKPLKKQADGSLVVEVEGVANVAEINPGLVPREIAVQIAPAAVPASSAIVESSQDLPCKVVEQLSSENVDEVIVTATANNELWVNVSAKAKALDDLMSDLQINMRSLAPCSWSPQVGEYVSVLYDALDMWHRGIVLSVASNVIEVRFIDYGTVEKLDVGKVKALPAEFSMLPSQGVKIQLSAGAPDKYQHPNLDDILHVRLITKLIDGTAIVAVVEK